MQRKRQVQALLDLAVEALVDAARAKRVGGAQPDQRRLRGDAEVRGHPNDQVEADAPAVLAIEEGRDRGARCEELGRERVGLDLLRVAAVSEIGNAVHRR